MQIKFLKSIVEHLINKQAILIVDLLAGKKDVNEFLIAKKLGLTINQTRNILYKLSDYGLVSFIRKKDKRKGWYIYFWTLNVYQSLNLFENKMKEELDQAKSQLKSREEKRYYLCKICSIEVTEEAALLNDFTCSECEEVYELSNNQGMIDSLNKTINRLEKEIQLIGKEIKIEEEKMDKKKVKKIKVAEDEKKAKRKKNRKINMDLKKKIAKKEAKKKTPKKNLKKSMKKKVSKLFDKLKKK
jgi:transcription factor E